MTHGSKVTELFLEAKNLVESEDVFWEDVERELEYLWSKIVRDKEKKTDHFLLNILWQPQRLTSLCKLI